MSALPSPFENFLFAQKRGYLSIPIGFPGIYFETKEMMKRKITYCFSADGRRTFIWDIDAVCLLFENGDKTSGSMQKS